VERLALRLVIPGTERDLIAIARARDRLMPAAAGTPDLESVLRITDKAVVYAMAGQAGLEIPETTVIGGDQAVLPKDFETRLPLLVKPLRSERAAENGVLVHTDVQMVRTPEQLRRLCGGLEPNEWLLQARVAGQLGAICGLAWGGEVVNAIHQRSLRVWPPDAGVSAYAQTVDADPALEAGVGQLIRLLGWSGIFQAQFIHTAQGPHLIDLNPRVYGSLALATAAGVNLPSLWSALAAGCSVERAPYRSGVRYRSEELDPRALFHLAREGRPLAALLGAIPRPHTAHAVVRLADPLPGLTSIGKLAMRWRRPTASSSLS
jgi:predicted ATP-grasp superfamily ATP-dependent carboligase